jgi:hypothetical protein
LSSHIVSCTPEEKRKTVTYSIYTAKEIEKQTSNLVLFFGTVSLSDTLEKGKNSSIIIMLLKNLCCKARSKCLFFRGVTVRQSQNKKTFNFPQSSNLFFKQNTPIPFLLYLRLAAWLMQAESSCQCAKLEKNTPPVD